MKAGSGEVRCVAAPALLQSGNHKPTKSDWFSRFLVMLSQQAQDFGQDLGTTRKGSGMQYIELAPVAAFLLRVNIITALAG